MANFYDFSSDQVNIFMMLLDKSGSMDGRERDMIAGLESYKEDFMSIPEANSVAISKSTFSSNLNLQEFRPLAEFNTSYSTGGWTAIYYSIVHSAKALLDYMAEVARKTKSSEIGGTFIVFSDGYSEHDMASWHNARDAVEMLNNAGVTTVFIAFGDAIDSEVGKRLGFLSTIDIKDKSRLTEFMGKELSQSCKEQSRSLKALGANFFSRAANNSSSAGYSNTTTQVLEDDSWMNEI